MPKTGKKERGRKPSLDLFLKEVPLYGRILHSTAFCVFKLSAYGNTPELNAGCYETNNRISLDRAYLDAKYILRDALKQNGTITQDDFDKAVRFLTKAGFRVEMN